MEGVLCQMDDFIGFGRTTEEHDKRLKQALKQIEVNTKFIWTVQDQVPGLRTSLSKMAYQQTQIKRGQNLK